jgi:prepilin-type N-terminal cleavage/methylation domain-containing protein
MPVPASQPAPYRTRRRGFTLLELIVVLVVVGLLAAVAIPTYARVLQRAADEAVNARNEAIARNVSAQLAFRDPTLTAADAFVIALAELPPASAHATTGVNALDACRSGDWQLVNGYCAIDAADADTQPANDAEFVYHQGPDSDGAVWFAFATQARDGVGAFCRMTPTGGREECWFGSYDSTEINTVTARNGPDRPPTAGAPSGDPAPTAPAAPTGLVATPLNGAVSLTWDAPGGDVTDYVIEVTVHGGDPYQVATGSADTTFVVSDLTNGVPHTFTVTAVHTTGPGPASDPVTATPAGAPNTPLASASAGNQAVTVSWNTPGDNGSPIVGYVVEIRSGGGEWTSVPHTGTDTSVIVEGLVNGTTYQFRVAAVNAVGQSGFSLPVHAVPATVAGAPDLDVTAAAGVATLTWNTPDDGGSPIVGYSVQYREAGAFGWTPVSHTTTDTTATVTGLTAGVSYEFRVAAVTEVGAGAWSLTATASWVDVAGPPTIDTVTPGNQALSVAFTAPTSDGGSPVTTYQYSTDGGATWRDRASGTTGSPLVITSRSGDNAALVNGTTYQVQLRAVTTAGPGAASNQVPATPFTTPPAPTASASVLNSTAVRVTFAPTGTGGSPITGWETQRATNTAFTADLVSNWAGSPADFSGLTPGTTYFFRTRAHNAAGPGAWSHTVSAVPASAPSAPTITGSTPGDRQGAITWSVPAANGSAIQGYRVSHRVCGGAWNVVAHVGAGTTSHTVTGLAHNTCHEYRVVAHNAIGDSAPSSPVSHTVWTSDLRQGEILHPGHFIRSGSGAFVAWMQGDGNFVIYQNGAAVWASGTHGSGFFLRHDPAHPGNLNVTRPDWTVAWSTFGQCSNRHKTGVRTVLQNDGNLVTYNSSGEALWARWGGIHGNQC